MHVPRLLEFYKLKNQIKNARFTIKMIIILKDLHIRKLQYYINRYKQKILLSPLKKKLKQLKKKKVYFSYKIY